MNTFFNTNQKRVQLYKIYIMNSMTCKSQNSGKYDLACMKQITDLWYTADGQFN